MKHGYLIDMDGVIYRGSEPIPGAAEFIRYLQAEQIPYLFLTNNSTYTAHDVVVKLRKFDIDTTREHVYTSALATAAWVHQQKPNGTAFVIGEGGLLNALADVNYAITSEQPDYVIVGEGRSLNFEQAEKAHRFIARGAHLVSTNADTWCPTDHGPRPGCGAIVAMLEAATGRKAYHVGKPNPFMMREARKKIGLSTDEVIMIGDTMDTDIRGATDLSFQSILVLTGSTTPETLAEYPFRPSRVVSSIAELVPKAGKERQPSPGETLLRDAMLAL
ncbi:MAG: TIGR01457 family HAD-type hydrolase [Bryobacterales bacterium]|jgi:NagD protein|nr:TIGR01457 family HAD-type hydrolase [Bryobacterales bacterium]